MNKLLGVFGVLAAVVFSGGQASAFSSIVFPVSLSGSPEDVTVSYSSSLAFTLADLSLAGPSPGATNILAGISGPLQPFTTSGGQTIAGGTGSFSEVITAPVGAYTFSYDTNATNFVNFSVSAVPLPASFPLFAMALIGLGMFGYHKVRSSRAANTAFAAV
jgi:hypothetical protein